MSHHHHQQATHEQDSAFGRKWSSIRDKVIKKASMSHPQRWMHGKVIGKKDGKLRANG